MVKFLFGVAILSGCQATKSKIELESQKTIYFRGMINKESFEKLKTLYEGIENKPDTLRINSLGGDLKTGLDIGFWIIDKNLKVKVTNYCLSSCANYIFPAGSERLLGEKAILAWHGSAQSESIFRSLERAAEKHFQDTGKKLSETSMKERVAEVKALRSKEKKFYNLLNIDSRFPIFGQDPKYRLLYKKEDYDAYYYTLPDMQKMGLNIVLIDEVWAPEKNRRFERIFRAEPDF